MQKPLNCSESLPGLSHSKERDETRMKGLVQTVGGTPLISAPRGPLVGESNFTSLHHPPHLRVRLFFSTGQCRLYVSTECECGPGSCAGKREHREGCGLDNPRGSKGQKVV